MFLWPVALLVLLPSARSIYFNSNDRAHFVLYPRLNLCQNGSFSFEFRTTTRNGLLLYTHDAHHADSIRVSIHHGKLIVEQKFSKIKSSQQFDQFVNDDRWYKIVFKRRSTLITEIVLYSVALRNVESRTIKSKVSTRLPFTLSNTSSVVYVGGLPWHVHTKEHLFRGFVRNLRYGLCGCAERIQHPVFSSSLAGEMHSEVCEQQSSLCSSESCECLNVDEEPRYQCDCSNKTCPMMSTMNKPRVQVNVDFTSVEYQSRSVESSSFTFGTQPNRFHVLKKDSGRASSNQSDLVNFTPVYGQDDHCMWDLNRCATDLTVTFVVSIERSNRPSLTLFTQYFKHGSSLHVNLIVVNGSSSSLHFDLWLPNNRGLLRATLVEFPYETPLFINLVYRSPSSSLAVFLFGQLVDHTIHPMNIQLNQPLSPSSTPSFSTLARFRSISWSYERSSIECCAIVHDNARLKRDLDALETCQSV